MQRTPGSLTIVLAGAVALAAVSSVRAGDLTVDEAACEQRSYAIMTNFTRRYAKCVTRCVRHVGVAGAAQCSKSGACANGPDDATCRCVTFAAVQAVGNQADRCSDCPECYVDVGGDPNPECRSDASSKTTTLGSFVESLLLSGSPAIFCDDSGSPDGLTTPEIKCQRAAAKVLLTFAKEKARCHATCRAAELAGTLPPGSCTPPVLSNPSAPQTVKNCVFRAEADAATKIDGRCEPAGGNRPECYGATDGSAWVDRIETFVDDEDPKFFCSSPSPAFLE